MKLKAPFDRTNMLKLKQSELRLYCDLLTQQTHELKNLVNSSYTQNGAAEVKETLESSRNDARIDIETPLQKSTDSHSVSSSFKSAEISNEAFASETSDFKPVADKTEGDFNVKVKLLPLQIHHPVSYIYNLLYFYSKWTISLPT